MALVRLALGLKDAEEPKQLSLQLTAPPMLYLLEDALKYDLLMALPQFQPM